jgi:hypothetical protein
MSTLTTLEKRVLEQVLGMGGGYVLHFSDRTFRDFFLDVVGLDVYDKKYALSSGSKANRMRAFWNLESDHRVATVLETLLKYAEVEGWELPASEKHSEYRRIVERLKSAAPVPDLEALAPNTAEREFEVLARSVKSSIEANEPEAGLDRLHTFVVRYIRVLAEREGVEVSQGKPLHSVFGELIKALKQRNAIESQMGERILKSTISTLEAFNDVRNNRSFAHDNELLSYNEALLIFRHVTTSIHFLGALTTQVPVEHAEEADDDLPF